MAMTDEEIAESRMREIYRLRKLINCSTYDSFIIERAIKFYNASKKAFYNSRATKADDAPLTEGEIKRWAEMEIIVDFIADIKVLDSDLFIEQAGIKEKESENEEK